MGVRPAADRLFTICRNSRSRCAGKRDHDEPEYAIKTHIKFMCVMPFDGARQENYEFWVILAIDRLTNSYRCVKFAGEDVVNDVAGRCGWRKESIK